MIKQLFASLYDRNLELNSRLFNLIMMAAVAASAVGLALSFFSGSTVGGLVTIGGVMVLLVLLLWLANRKGLYGVCSFLMTFLVNVVLFPVIFFHTGGVESGMNDWFVLGILAIFLLLSGKTLCITLIFSLLSFSGCYLVAYFHPEMIHFLTTRKDIYTDTYFSMIAVSLVTGLVIKFQKRIYETEQEISRKQQEDLERANQTKNRFFANMSHEIRTPINTIVGLNEINLRENISPEEVEENSINIQRASRMLLSLINDILDLSKIESGKMEIVPRQYSVAAMLSDLVNINWIRAYEKKLEFKLDISPEIPSVLYGDDIRIKQILTNLLTNAVKYTPKGSVTIRVRTETAGKSRVRLICSVTDTGMGIRKEDIPYLFDSFRRMDEKNNGVIEGTGLGLSISQQLAEMMQGTITVDSVYQRGSTFTVMLEQEIVDSTPIGDMNQLAKLTLSGREKYRKSFEAPEARILVVDDNEMNRIVVSKLLRDTKVQVDMAVSGAQCLEMTMKHYYHVIFMDHMMPGMDGLETLEHIREQEHGLCRKTPAVALTANTFAGAYDLYKRRGFEGYLVKPVNGVVLENMLLKLLPAELVEETPEKAKKAEEEKKEGYTIYRHERKKLLITTESVCDLSEDILKKYDIPCICYYVQTEEGKFRDTKEISADNLTAYLSYGEKKAGSMSPETGEYETFFADALDRSRQVLHISMASKVGSGYEKALQASRGFDNVYITDCGHFSSSMGLIVVKAAKMAQNGASLQEILDEIERLKGMASTSFILNTTESLYRGGRMGTDLKKFCDAFLLRPSFEVKNGRIVCCGVYSGTKEQAYRKYIRRTLKGKKNIDSEVLFLTYAGCSLKTRQMLLEEIRKYQQFDTIIEQQTSAAIGSHGGLGTFGLLYLRRNA